MKRLYFLLVILCLTGNLRAADSQTGKGLLTQSSEPAHFSNRTYLLNVNEAVQVSPILGKLGTSYFGLLNDFSGELGSIYGNLTYFDFDEKELLVNDRELLKLEYKNLPSYRTERDKIIFHDKSEEIKSHQFEVRAYKRKTEAEDRHPLIRWIKRAERSQLRQFVEKVTAKDAMLLKESVSIDFKDVVYNISHYGVVYGAVTLRQFSIARLGVPNTFVILKLEISDDIDVPLTLREKRSVEHIFTRLDEDIRKLISGNTPFMDFGYKAYYDLSESVLPTKSILEKNPMIFRLLQTLLLVFIGAVLLFLLLHNKNIKTLKRISYRIRR